MNAAEEKYKREAIRGVLVRIQKGETLTREQLFAGAPLAASRADWQSSILRKLAIAGIIDQAASKGQFPRGQNKWRIVPGTDVDLYLNNPQALTAALRGSSDIDDFDTAEPDVQVSDRVRAEQRLAAIRDRAPKADAPEVIPVQAEPEVVAPQEQIPATDPPGTDISVLEAMLKLSYANMQNLVYIRKIVDEQGESIARLESKLDALLKLWQPANG